MVVDVDSIRGFFSQSAECLLTDPKAPAMHQQLVAALEKGLTGNTPVSPETATAADETLEQTNVTIAKLEAVLQQMLDLETYNELLDIVRDLIKDQDSLTDKTKQERKRQAIEDLK